MCETLTTDQKEFKFKEGDSTTLNEFNELFKKLFARTWVVNGQEFHLPSLGWDMGYNSRKQSLGIISYRGKRNYTTREVTLHDKMVYISKVLLSQNLDKAADFEDTIRHEIAHAIDVEIRGKSYHDNHWKMICRELGADDTRLHEGFLNKPKGKYTLTCPNPDCDVVNERYRKVKRVPACGKCCKKYSGGNFDPKYRFEVTQNY
jgi:predicted SprT family Zn-dependent metalloprotease